MGFVVGRGSREFQHKIGLRAIPDTPIDCSRPLGVKGYTKPVAASPMVSLVPKVAELEKAPRARKKSSRDELSSPVLTLHQKLPESIGVIPNSVESLPVFTRRSSMPVDLIKRVVANYYRVGVFELQGSLRARFATTRYVAMFLASRLTWNKPDEIGLAFDNRAPTTVLYAIQQINKRARTDKRLVSDIRKIHWLLIEANTQQLSQQ